MTAPASATTLRHMGILPDLAGWLRLACEQRGWSSADLARKSDLSQPFISELLSGKRKGRSHDTQVLLAQAFGLSHAEFVEAVRTRAFPLAGAAGQTTEQAILSDPDLTSAQREALVVHYRSYRRR